MVVKFIKKGEKLFGYTYRGEAIYSISTKDERKSEKLFDAFVGKNDDCRKASGRNENRRCKEKNRVLE